MRVTILKFCTCLLMCIGFTPAMAQEISEKEIEAKEDSIFNIKFSEQAHYAEVTMDLIMKDDKDVSAAEQQSMLLLQTHIIEIFSKRLNMNNADVKEIWDTIEDKCQNITVKRGDLASVFAYMAKDALKGWLGNKKIKPLTPEDSIILFGPKVPDALPDSPQTELADTESTKTEVVKVDTIKVEEPVVEPEPEPVTPSLPSKPVVVPDFCKKLMAKADKQALEEFLEDGALYNELMYGSSSEMQNLIKCYAVVIDKSSGKIKAVLDKGESERVNFITKEKDSLNKYNNEQYEIIYVQEMK